MKWPAQKMVGDLLGEVDRAMLNLKAGCLAAVSASERDRLSAQGMFGLFGLLSDTQQTIADALASTSLEAVARTEKERPLLSPAIVLGKLRTEIGNAQAWIRDSWPEVNGAKAAWVLPESATGKPTDYTMTSEATQPLRVILNRITGEIE